MDEQARAAYGAGSWPQATQEEFEKMARERETTEMRAAVDAGNLEADRNAGHPVGADVEVEHPVDQMHQRTGGIEMAMDLDSPFMRFRSREDDMTTENQSAPPIASERFYENLADAFGVEVDDVKAAARLGRVPDEREMLARRVFGDVLVEELGRLDESHVGRWAAERALDYVENLEASIYSGQKVVVGVAENDAQPGDTVRLRIGDTALPSAGFTPEAPQRGSTARVYGVTNEGSYFDEHVELRSPFLPAALRRALEQTLHGWGGDPSSLCKIMISVTR